MSEEKKRIEKDETKDKPVAQIHSMLSCPLATGGMQI